MTLALAGCATDTRFQKLPDHPGGTQPWLQPQIETGQSLVQEGTHPFAHTSALWGLDMECGAYLTDSETIVVYNIVNRAVSSVQLNEIGITVTDPQGQSLPHSPKSKWSQPAVLGAGLGVMGSEVFVGVPTNYPVIVTWRLANGKEMKYPFDGPAK